MKKFLISAIALVLATAGAMAQNGQGGQRQRVDPTEMHTRQAERLVKQMKLADDKAEAFKVLYLDYQTARQNAVNPKGEETSEEKVDMKKLTDAQATELIQKQLAGQEAQLAVDKDYLPKFLEILTPSQAAQIYLQQRGGRRGGQGQQQGGGRPGGGGEGFGGGRPGGDF